MRSLIAYSALLVAISFASFAADSTQKSIQLPPDNAMAELKPGQGVEVAKANCVACHSTDYIVWQPGRDAKQWEAEVKKMRDVFGAPINDAEAKTIVEYLTAVYGPSPKPSGPTRQSAGKENPSSKNF